LETAKPSPCRRSHGTRDLRSRASRKNLGKTSAPAAHCSRLTSFAAPCGRRSSFGGLPPVDLPFAVRTSGGAPHGRAARRSPPENRSPIPGSITKSGIWGFLLSSITDGPQWMAIGRKYF
jgi:hypothetical protein